MYLKQLVKTKNRMSNTSYIQNFPLSKKEKTPSIPVARLLKPTVAQAKTAELITFTCATAINFIWQTEVKSPCLFVSLLSFFENGSHCRDDCGLGAAGCCGHRDDSREGGSGGEEGGLCQSHWYC